MAQYRSELDTLFYRRVSWSVASRIFRFLIAYWFVTIPLILVFVQVWLGILAAVACIAITHLISRAKIDRVNEAIAAFGDHDAFRVSQAINIDWTETAVNVGLAKDLRFQQGQGIRAAYATLSPTSTQRSFAAISNGTNPEQFIYPEFLGSRPSPLGVEFHLKMIDTQTVEDYQACAPRLAAIWHSLLSQVSSINGGFLACYEVRVRVKKQEPNVVVLIVVYKDPFSQPVPVQIAGPGVSVTSSNPIFLALSEEGDNVFWNLAQDAYHMAVQGQTRSGKTGFTYNLLYQASERPDVLIAGCDPSGILLAPFRNSGHAEWQALGTSDMQHHADVLEKIVVEMDRRIQSLAPRYMDKLESFTPDMPVILVILEEFPALLKAAVTADKKIAATISMNYSRLLAEGAKAGIRLVLIIQRADASIIGGAERSNIGIRLSLRVDNGDAVRMLHDSPDPTVVERITGVQPGIAYIQSPTVGTAWIKVPWVGSYREWAPQIEYIVSQVRPFRRNELPPAESPGSDDEPPLPDLNK